ncbi:hypothetical protein BA917_03425 [Helicobacter pullorum]|nr:hypothetical protein BA917_03425 [Helicobacter pullorum]
MDNLLVFSKSLLIAYFPHKIKLKAHNYTKINPLLLITHNKSHNILYFMQVKSINIHNFNLAKLILDTHKDSLLIPNQLFFSFKLCFLRAFIYLST